MTHYPLLFGRRELVEGNGFIAGVAVAGRALLTEEDGEFWAEGVNPGGFAANGESPAEALAKLCEELRVILFDIASETSTFEAFKEEAERFFNETSEMARREWEAAVQAVRQGAVSADWLVQRPADSPRGIEVVLLEKWTAKADHNQEGETALAA